jgi:hypothetical protein
MAVLDTVEFHIDAKHIHIPSSITQVSIQDLYDTIREFEEDNPQVNVIATAGGKEILNPTTRVGVTLTLWGWLIEFEARAGPTWTLCSITGGNIVANDITYVDFLGGAPATTLEGAIVPSAYVTVNTQSSSSPTLNELTIIQYGSYNEGVSLDFTSAYTGTEWPVGTGQQPVNNLADALSIANTNGFTTIYLLAEDNDFMSGSTVTGFKIIGASTEHHVHLMSGSTFTNCAFENVHIHGDLFGTTRLDNCHIADIDGANGEARHCILEIGTTTLQAAGDWNLIDCVSGIAGTGTHTVDCNGSGTLQVRNYTGGVLVTNKTSGDCSIDMVSGNVVLDATCTGGTIVTRGISNFTNNSNGSNVKARGHMLEEIQTTRIITESIRPTHQGFGEVFFVDPVNGLDTNDGITENSSLKTFAAAHALCVDGRNDIIQFINPSSAGATVTENMVITKNNVHLRATSRDITFKPASAGATVLTVGDATGTNGYSCSVSGLLIDADKAVTGGNHCIQVNGKFCLLNAVWAKQSILSCVKFNGGDYHVIIDGEIEKSDSHGVETEDLDLPSGSPREITITGRSNIYLNTGDGVHLGADVGEKGSTTRLVRILQGEIARNGGYGIHADADVDGLTIGNVIIHANNGGHGFPQTNILTMDSHAEKDEHHEKTAESVWDYLTEDIVTTGSIGEFVKNKLLTTAKFLGLK